MRSEIHSGHRARLREKFQSMPLDSFPEHEILEYLLTYAIKQQNVNPLAHEILNHFGSLRAVFDASPEQLKEVKGVGDTVVSLLTLVPKLTKYYYNHPPGSDKKVNLLRIADREKFFSPKFIGEKEEVLYAAYLNSNYELLREAEVSRGSVNQVGIDTRRIMDDCSRTRATLVILAHNHLGNPDISAQDYDATATLAKALQPMGVELVDHLVVCHGQVQSMDKLGRIRRV